MAAVTLLGSVTFDTNSGTHTVVATPAVDDLIVIVAANTGNTASVTPTDTQGGDYALVNSAVKNTSADTLQFWVRKTKITSATSTTFSHAPGTSTGGGLAVLKATGMSRVGLAAIRQSAVQSNQAAAGTPTPVLGSAALTGNALIGAVFNATSPATMTPRSSPAWTERNDSGYSTPTTGLETMSIDSGETGTSIAWGGTSASAFASGVIELDTSAATPIDDGEGWYAGAQRSFAAVAIAGAAAALSVAVQINQQLPYNEEFGLGPPVPADVSMSSAPTQRAQVAPVQVRWWAQDELPTAVPVALDDSGWMPPWSAPPAPVRLLAVDVDVFVPTLRALDDGAAWSAPIVLRAAPIVPMAWEGQADLVPTPPPSAPSDAGFQVFGQRAVAQTQLLRWYAGDELPVVAVPVVEADQWSAPIVVLPPAKALPPFDTGSEVVPAAAPSAPSDGAFAVFGQRGRSEMRLLRWTQVDELPSAPTFRPPDEDVPIPTAAPATFQVIVWAGDEEIVPAVPPALDDGYWPLPRPLAAPIVAPVSQADEQIVPQPAAFALDDSVYAPPTFAQSYQVIVWAGDDDIVPAATTIALDDAGWQSPLLGQAAISADAIALWRLEQDSLPGTEFEDDSVPLQEPQIAAAQPMYPWQGQGEEFVPGPAAPLVDEAADWSAPIIVAAKPDLPDAWVSDEAVPVTVAAALDDQQFAPLAQQRATLIASPAFFAGDDIVPQPVPLRVDLDFLPPPLELRSYQPRADYRVFQDDGNFTPAPVYTFTHDSRERFGHKHEQAKKSRIGASNVRVRGSRIGGSRQ